ncbi:MAG TPA: kelch repeat-containing protein [Solirubrobacterales bacterium]|nr:kelch repeat-containing protein [Solirubrobacterales bacterium]
MGQRGFKLLGTLTIAMLVVLVIGVLAATGPIELPGQWRQTLGLSDEFTYPPCRLGMYRHSPHSPPAPQRPAWRFEPRAPRAPVEGSAVAIGPVIYATNGERPENLRTVLAYDTRSKTWSQPTRSPVGLNHSQAAAYRGDLYLAGGYLEGDEATDSLWRYDPAADRWRELPPMGLARGGAGTAVIGDKLYVAGGAPQTFGVSLVGSPYGRLEIYDFESESWSTGPDMPDPRHHTVAVGLGGKLYVAGGRDGLLDLNNSTPPSAEFDRFDPIQNTWERLPQMPLGAGFVGITAAAGKVVIVGGEDQTQWEDGGGWASPSAWAFDPQTERWQRLPDLHIERRGFGAATAGGRVYALMGSYCPGLTAEGPRGTRTVESLPVAAVRRG